MTWRDIQVILTQTLTNAELERVTQEANKFANGLHLIDPNYPTGDTAIPFMDPRWDFNKSDQCWFGDHYLIYKKAGLKGGSHMNVSAVTQETIENPLPF